MKIINIIFILALAIGSLQAQCFEDRHSTSWYEAWISCEKSVGPNSERESSHWIMYDLSKSYELGSSHFWNINDPDHLDRGISKAIIDVSHDGDQWIFADTLFLQRGTGQSIYEGQEGPDLDGVSGRFVLITVIETYGNGDCAGFSELRMEREELTTDVIDEKWVNGCLEITATPNPFIDNTKIEVTASCPGEIEWSVSNTLGQVMSRGQLRLNNSKGIIEISDRDMPLGNHLLTLTQDGKALSIVLNRME